MSCRSFFFSSRLNMILRRGAHQARAVHISVVSRGSQITDGNRSPGQTSVSRSSPTVVMRLVSQDELLIHTVTSRWAQDIFAHCAHQELPRALTQSSLDLRLESKHLACPQVLLVHTHSDPQSSGTQSHKPSSPESPCPGLGEKPAPVSAARKHPEKGMCVILGRAKLCKAEKPTSTP